MSLQHSFDLQNKQLTAAKVRDPGLKIGPPPSSLLAGTSPHTTVMPSILGTPGPGLGATSKLPAGGKSMVASTPLPGGAKGTITEEQSDEENQSANPALDPKYLQPSKPPTGNGGASAARKTLTKKAASKSPFSPRQTSPAGAKGSKLPGKKTTLAESVYFS